ncbi:PH domain leucine-rich repeat-containing protein phosphatase 1 [Lemmus lemmus]
MTGNPHLALDHKSLEPLNNIRCFKIDQPSAEDASGASAVWSHGYTETSGVKSKLCVAALSVNNFRDNREALCGVFDGDRNVEVPYLLQCTMSDILAEELQETKTEDEHRVNTFIAMQRKLGAAGQKLGGAAVLRHIKLDPVDPGGSFTLTSANDGKCQTVLCRNGKPLPLSRSYIMSCEEELKRIKQPSSLRMASAFSDNGLDSVDEEPIEDVFRKGSRVEVEVDIHCSQAKEKEKQQHLFQVPAEASDEGIAISDNEDESGLSKKADFSAVGTIGRHRANGSVAPQERSHNVIEVATDAPLRKPEGYFAAPAQPDLDDQFIIPRS